LLSRNEKDRTGSFPRIVSAIRDLSAGTLLLDGEVVVFDKKRVSRFQLLQRGEGDPVYAVFDCLFRDGKDLRREPLASRRNVLENVIRSNQELLIAHKLDGNGLEAFRTAQHRGYEGLVAKDLSSSYVSGRSKKWLKVKVHQEDEFIIVGFTPPAGARQHFGALLLAAYQHGKLRYVGKVGTGFDQKALSELHKRFLPLARKETMLADPPRGKGITFLAPRLVAQVAFQEWTADGKLRQPVFLGLRDDKRPQDVVVPESVK
jgi:bifunctional non-homologous end joining protein LigD